MCWCAKFESNRRNINRKKKLSVYDYCLHLQLRLSVITTCCFPPRMDIWSCSKSHKYYFILSESVRRLKMNKYINWSLQICHPNIFRFDLSFRSVVQMTKRFQSRYIERYTSDWCANINDLRDLVGGGESHSIYDQRIKYWKNYYEIIKCASTAAILI